MKGHAAVAQRCLPRRRAAPVTIFSRVLPVFAVWPSTKVQAGSDADLEAEAFEPLFGLRELVLAVSLHLRRALLLCAHLRFELVDRHLEVAHLRVAVAQRVLQVGKGAVVSLQLSVAVLDELQVVLEERQWGVREAMGERGREAVLRWGGKRAHLKVDLELLEVFALLRNLTVALCNGALQRLSTRSTAPSLRCCLLPVWAGGASAAEPAKPRTRHRPRSHGTFLPSTPPLHPRRAPCAQRGQRLTWMRYSFMSCSSFSFWPMSVRSALPAWSCDPVIVDPAREPTVDAPIDPEPAPSAALAASGASGAPCARHTARGQEAHQTPGAGLAAPQRR